MMKLKQKQLGSISFLQSVNKEMKCSFCLIINSSHQLINDSEQSYQIYDEDLYTDKGK